MNDSNINDNVVADAATLNIAENAEVAASQNADNTQAASLDDLSEEQLIEVFAETLLEEKGITDGLDDEVHNQMIDDLKERILFQVNRQLIAALPEEQFNELNAKLDSGEYKEEDLLNIIESSGINAEEITQKTLLDFRNAYLGNTPETEQNN